MSKDFTLCFAFVFTSIAACFSQTSRIAVSGKIISQSTGEPLGYATIRLTTNGASTMSNEKGEFVFKIPKENINDSISVTHVGYQRHVFLTSRANVSNTVIRLRENSGQLQEVTVKAINALELVKKAIARIPDNYPSRPYLLKGFYRLTGRKENNIVHMSEAVFDIYNETYARRKKQVKLIKSRFDKDLTAFNGNDEFNFGSSAEDILDYDLVSNVSESGMLNNRDMKHYKFTYKGMIDYNGSKAYKIGFDQKDGVKKSLNQGTILINADNLAFLEFRYRLSPKGIKYWSLGFAKRMLLSLSRIRIDLLQDSTVISYRRYGGRYYLNHVKGASLWHITGGRDHFELNPFRLKNTYLVTDIDTGAIKAFQSNEIFASSRFMENAAGPNSLLGIDTFWNEYNLIQPDFNVDSVVGVIHANNRSLNHKDSLVRVLSKIKKDQAARIDTVFSFYHRVNQFNGVALVEYKGKIIYEKAFGLANKGKNISNTIHTQFRIGSASKQFTSMLIMQLVKEGRMHVEDTVGKYLPGYVHGKVTIQQLLTHQSGIPNYTANEEYLAKTVTKKYPLKELVWQFCSDPLEFDPGTAFHYTNSGYLVLALIIEEITGKKYGEVLTERIFTPLEMKASFFGSDSPLATEMATGYVNEEPEMPYAVENITGAGGITSTANDLLRWSHAVSSAALLGEEEMKEVFKPRVEWNEWGAYYGYGWMIDRLEFRASKQHSIQYHPGTEPGFYTMLLRQPDKGIVIILLNNKGDFPRFDIADLILNELN